MFKVFIVLFAVILSSRSFGARVIAIGDLHGRLVTFQDVLRKAQIIDENGEWIAYDTDVIQVGDVLDKGDNELELVEYMQELSDIAPLFGCSFRWLLGNHELYNLQFDFSHVSKRGFSDFSFEYDTSAHIPSWVKDFPKKQRGRVISIYKGVLHHFLTQSLGAIIIDSTLYVHASITKDIISLGVDKINRHVKDFMNGLIIAPYYFYKSSGPFESRYFTKNVTAKKCNQLSTFLEQLGVRRVVVGHTKQKNGIHSICDGKLWPIDSHISSYKKGFQEGIIINNDDVYVIR
jgi:hypothetical protein